MGVDIERRGKISIQIEVIKEFSRAALEDVLLLEKKCFPKEWQYAGVAEYYEAMLKDKNNINIFLKDGNKNGGYLLAVPFNSVFNSLKEYDSGLKLDEENDKTKIYLETIQILPEFRGMNGAEKLIMKMCDEGKKRGMNKFSIHARKINGLDAKIKKMFAGKINESRSVDAWHYGGNEPYEYKEGYI
jgi:ribosomal protein S18 acetylase RimI-like enzyme